MTYLKQTKSWHQDGKNWQNLNATDTNILSFTKSHKDEFIFSHTEG